MLRRTMSHPCTLCEPIFYSYTEMSDRVEKGEGLRGRNLSHFMEGGGVIRLGKVGGLGWIKCEYVLYVIILFLINTCNKASFFTNLQQ